MEPVVNRVITHIGFRAEVICRERVDGWSFEIGTVAEYNLLSV